MPERKTAWARVLGSSIGGEERVMKAQLQCTFEGSFWEFVAWMEGTFKTPDDMMLKVVVGDAVAKTDPTDAPPKAPPPRSTPPFTGSLPPQFKTHIDSGRMTEQDARYVMAAWCAGDRIGAMRLMRECSGIDLKAVKGFVDGLPRF